MDSTVQQMTQEPLLWGNRIGAGMEWDGTHEVRGSAVSGFLGNLHDSEEGSRHRERGLMWRKLREPAQSVNRDFFKGVSVVPALRSEMRPQVTWG